jgi:hypothetical protein
LTGAEAQSTEGLDFGVAEYPFKATPMAEIMNETEGFTRLIYEKGSGKILGGHIYGSVAIMNSLIGEVTPPFGPQVWIAGPLCREKIGAIAREAWPFLGAWTAALLVTVLIPHIAMFLVNLFR